MKTLNTKIDNKVGKTIRTPVRLPVKLKEELNSAVINDGYGFKGRSLWVEDAINSLLSFESFYDLVALDEDLNTAFIPDGFSLTTTTRDRLDNAIIVVRQHYPKMNAVLSALIRTAIMQKLIRG